MNKYTVTFLLLLISGGMLYAANISELKFKQNSTIKIPDEQLLLHIQQRIGASFDPKMVNEDIKRLFKTGIFQDVKAESVNKKDGSISLTYILTAKPRVRKVRFNGNAKYNNHDLYKEISVVEGLALDDSKLQESITKLKKFYSSKGYNDASIIFQIEKGENEEVDVIFNIDEKLRLKVNNVTFEGNTVFSALKLKLNIQNKWSPLSGIFEVGLFNRDELELDKARIRELYWNLGYLDFEIKDLQVTQNEDDPEFVDIHFVLDEGQPYKIGELHISGNSVYQSEDLSNFVVLKKGDTFNFQKEQASCKGVAALYEELGYADVQCEPVRRANYETHVVDIDFVVKEGRKYTVRDVVISGNLVTKDKVIRRELAIQPGDPVDRNRIEATQARLMGMGYFNDVKTLVTNAESINEKDINIQVEEKDMFNLRIGAGFSDVNSLMGMAEISNNNFDLLDPLNWFTGGGQRLRIQGIVGIERMGFNVDFSEPWLFDMPLKFDVNGYMNQSEYDDWDEYRVGVRTSLTRRIFDDFTSISVGYKFENVDVKHITSYASREITKYKGDNLVSQFSIMLDRDTRDSLMMPTSGYNINLLGAFAPDLIGSTNGFYRAELKGSIYYPLFDKAIILMAGARLGVVGGFDGDDAPIFERYFLGGGDSIRGFEFREISPTDKNGVRKGGQTMLLVTSEISHPIWDFIRGAVFVDIGNTWADSWEFGKVNIGVGYGLRIVLPYLNAPIKLDLAYPVLNEQKGYKSKLRFHFNMGFTF